MADSFILLRLISLLYVTCDILICVLFLHNIEIVYKHCVYQETTIVWVQSTHLNIIIQKMLSATNLPQFYCINSIRGILLYL